MMFVFQFLCCRWSLSLHSSCTFPLFGLSLLSFCYVLPRRRSCDCRARSRTRPDAAEAWVGGGPKPAPAPRREGRGPCGRGDGRGLPPSTLCAGGGRAPDSRSEGLEVSGGVRAEQTLIFEWRTSPVRRGELPDSSTWGFLRVVNSCCASCAHTHVRIGFVIRL